MKEITIIKTKFISIDCKNMVNNCLPIPEITRDDRKHPYVMTEIEVVYEGKPINKMSFGWSTAPFRIKVTSTNYPKGGASGAHNHVYHFDQEYNLNIDEINAIIKNITDFNKIYSITGAYCKHLINIDKEADDIPDFLAGVNVTIMLNGNHYSTLLLSIEGMISEIPFAGIMPLILNDDYIDDIFEGKHEALKICDTPLKL